MQKDRLEELTERIVNFQRDRNWDNVPSDIAKSIVIEAAELLEHFQWDEGSSKTQKEKMAAKNIEEIESEVSDIFWYLIAFCDKCGIDPIETVNKKFPHHEKKYPVNEFKNTSSEKYWSRKKEYRTKT